MLAERSAVEKKIFSALEATPPRIPVILGTCGSGRTAVLRRLSEQVELEAEYIDVARVATTPEDFLSSITRATHCQLPSLPPGTEATSSPRTAFDGVCRFLEHARTQAGDNVTFLLDDAVEIRTFENFPGLRGVVRELWRTVCESPNRFVLASRFVNRTLRLFRDAPERFEFVHLPPLTHAEVTLMLAEFNIGETDDERLELARIMHALTAGRPLYLRLLAEATAAMGSGDPVSALAAQMAPGAPLSSACRFCYEFRLHRARGYGALKAILGVLADKEPLTLTEIARRIGRTPGSTKDYLSWLEDVDLLTVQQKRYSFPDPVLRLWVHLHGQAKPPEDEDLAREVQEYAVNRFPYMEPTMVVAEPSPVQADSEGPDHSWNMIEID